MTALGTILRNVDWVAFPPPPTEGAVALGQGIYTVPETCRILRPSMTPRKVHYWLDTELLGEPLRRGRRGIRRCLPSNRSSRFVPFNGFGTT